MAFKTAFKSATAMLLLVIASSLPAGAASFIDKNKTVTCKNGGTSSSSISLAKAICGCVKKGGAVGHSTKNCAMPKKK